MSPVCANLITARRKPAEAFIASSSDPCEPPITFTSALFLKNGASSSAFSCGVDTSQVPYTMTVGMTT